MLQKDDSQFEGLEVCTWNYSNVFSTFPVAAVDFREQGLPTSVAAIAQLKLLRDLDFSNNNIQEQHVGAVAQMLTALPELNEVAFSRCALSGKSTPALIDGLQ